MSEALAVRAPIARLRDFVELGKPRLSLLVIFTAAVGAWLAPLALSWPRTLAFLLATSTLVAAANTLNCWLERELDGRMRRTRNRPLPAGRVEPGAALASGLILAALSLAVLAAATNALTTSLGAVALATYVLAYTPLKRLTPWAVFVGAVPGAIPPLMGWTAATGGTAVAGWVLFAILFFWQLPHFVAISLYLKEDFRRAGFRVLPLVRGDLAARRHLFAYTLVLVGVSLTVQPLGLAGTVYTICAALLALPFVAIAAIGLRRATGAAWASRIFGYTLLYLPILITVLVLDAN